MDKRQPLHCTGRCRRFKSFQLTGSDAATLAVRNYWISSLGEWPHVYCSLGTLIRVAQCSRYIGYVWFNDVGVLVRIAPILSNWNIDGQQREILLCKVFMQYNILEYFRVKWKITLYIEIYTKVLISNGHIKRLLKSNYSID